MKQARVLQGDLTCGAIRAASYGTDVFVEERHYVWILESWIPTSWLIASLQEQVQQLASQVPCSGYNREVEIPFPSPQHNPTAAQVGLVEMGFNLGVQSLIQKFPQFCAEVKTNDWKNAAKECKRKPPISDCRNEETERLFRLAVTGD